MKNAKVWIAVLTASFVLYVVVGVSNRSSPGPLSAVHARDSKLTGFNSCAQCHGGWFGSMTEACLECHAPIERQIARKEGLHGSMTLEKAEACATCHSEHHGADFEMVNRLSFAQAGVPDPLKFDHGIIGYKMEGRHLELTCAECHEHANAEVLPEGAQRFMGLDQNCESCHEDPHVPSYALACNECHGQTSFNDLAPVDHDEHLPLIGGHANIACTECHEKGTPYGLSRIGRSRDRAERTCKTCHESPHTDPFVAGVALQTGHTPDAGCVTCHAADHDSFRDERLTVTAEQHAVSGFELEKPHDQVSCEDCHESARPDFKARYPGRKADDCVSCHQDPHGGQFKNDGCIQCHERTHFDPHAFTVKMHARTNLRLDGSHLDAECNDCHKPAKKNTPRVFRDTPDDCAKCHKDAHRGFFKKYRKRFRKTKHGQCAHCHKTTEFSEIKQKRFQHGEWTGFAIRGAHAQATCEACHPRTKKPDARGRRFGRIKKYKDCASCHADPHNGVFDGRGQPQRVGGKASCARCHSENSFRVLSDFDHALWTGFALEGAHARADCSTCHEPRRRPDKDGRRWGRAAGNRCADCHEDPHAGQFKIDGVVSCDRCHDSADSFQKLKFRHNLDSRFRLDKAHAGLSCNKCHKPYRVGTKQIIRYRPMGRECADCHSPQKDPLRRRGKRTR